MEIRYMLKSRVDQAGILSGRNLFAVEGVLGIVFALGFLTLTPQLLALYGIGVSAGSMLMTRFLAAFLLAAGITQFTARRHADSAAGRSITAGFLATNVLLAVVASVAIVRGDANLLGLGFIALWVVEGSWRAYLTLYIYRGPVAREGATV